MPIPAIQLGARSIKIVVVLDAAQVAEALQPFATVDARVPVVIAVEGRKLRFDVAPIDPEMPRHGSPSTARTMWPCWCRGS